jgi:hypothetical protein
VYTYIVWFFFFVVVIIFLLLLIEHLLTEQERERRRSNKYQPAFHLNNTGSPTNNLVNSRIPSFFWPIYQDLFVKIGEHLQIDMSIIDYNYIRLSKCLDIWAKERMRRFNKKAEEVTLDQIEYGIALEFFLQIDGK